LRFSIDEATPAAKKSTKAAQSSTRTHQDDATTHQFCSGERTDLVPGKRAGKLSDQFFSLFFIRLSNTVATLFKG
jgi:hypothetical protein